MTWVPDACTLPTAERPLRVAEFDQLFQRALTSVERMNERRIVLTLHGGPNLEATVRDLADRESACCAFFAFSVEPVADGVRLAIEVPPAHVPVLDGLVGRAEAVLTSHASQPTG